MEKDIDVVSVILAIAHLPTMFCLENFPLFSIVGSSYCHMRLHQKI